MTGQRIDVIDIEGYLSIRSAQVPLRNLDVLVGANGSGKSNFVSAFELLGRTVDRELGWYVGRERGGAAALMHGWEEATEIRLQIEFERNGYEARLVAGANDELVFAGERIWFAGDGAGAPYDLDLGRGQRESRLHEEVEERGPHSIARDVLELLRGCRVYHFHDTSQDAPVKRFADDGDNLALAADAANLAPFLARLREAEPAAYRRIVSAIRQVAPFFDDFILESESPGRMRLRWRQGGHNRALHAGALSDGTLRYICLTALLLQPDLPNLVVLDEPELGLHPFAIVRLASMLEMASRQAQVVIATQSVTLTNQFSLDDIVIVERRDGQSTFDRPKPEPLAAWLEDYSLGELWEKNLLGGTPGRE